MSSVPGTLKGPVSTFKKKKRKKKERSSNGITILRVDETASWKPPGAATNGETTARLEKKKSYRLTEEQTKTQRSGQHAVETEQHTETDRKWMCE